MYQLFNLEFSNKLQNLIRRQNKPNGSTDSHSINGPGTKGPG
jgi:hypothetical protein